MPPHFIQTGTRNKYHNTPCDTLVELYDNLKTKSFEKKLYEG